MVRDGAELRTGISWVGFCPCARWDCKAPSWLQGVEAGVSDLLDLGQHIPLPLGKQSSARALVFSFRARRTSLGWDVVLGVW